MTPQIGLIIVLIISAAIVFGNYKLIKAWSKVLKSSLGKFLKVSVVVISSLFLLGLLITAVILINDIWENRLKKQDGFDGIKLGWTRDEVIFRKGNPTQTEKRAGNMQIDKYSGLWVEYLDDKVLGISKFCDAYDYNKINGLACNDNLDKLLKIYGEPKDVSVSNDKTSRLYCYPKYNVCYEVRLASIFSRYVMEGASREYLTPEQIKEMEALNAPPKKLVPPEDLPDNLKPKVVKKKFWENDIKVEDTDHCAPNLSRAERLKRLALKGNVRETGANTYTAGNGYVTYVTFGYSGDLISCN